MRLEEKETIEINHWKTSVYESPDTFSMQSILYKLREAGVFWEKLERYRHIFEQGDTILEIGAGQGWAGTLIKQQFPNKHVTVSDISPYAIEVVSHWETFFTILLDKKIACKSYEISLDDNSVDIVFCYASAHHFVAHKKTLEEVYRILKKGGSLLYLHEPSCRRYIYPLAHWRVNKKRPAVPEDVLVYADMVQFAKECGFSEAAYRFDPTTLNRGVLEGMYYAMLQRIGVLKHVFPCTADYIFKK